MDSYSSSWRYNSYYQEPPRQVMRYNEVDQRMGVTNQVSSLGSRVDNVVNRVSRIDSKLDTLSSQIDQLLRQRHIPTHHDTLGYTYFHDEPTYVQEYGYHRDLPNTYSNMYNPDLSYDPNFRWSQQMNQQDIPRAPRDLSFEEKVLRSLENLGTRNQELLSEAQSLADSRTQMDEIRKENNKMENMEEMTKFKQILKTTSPLDEDEYIPAYTLFFENMCTQESSLHVDSDIKVETKEDNFRAHSIDEEIKENILSITSDKTESQNMEGDNMKEIVREYDMHSRDEIEEDILLENSIDEEFNENVVREIPTLGENDKVKEEVQHDMNINLLLSDDQLVSAKTSALEKIDLEVVANERREATTCIFLGWKVYVDERVIYDTKNNSSTYEKRKKALRGKHVVRYFFIHKKKGWLFEYLFCVFTTKGQAHWHGLYDLSGQTLKPYINGLGDRQITDDALLLE